jgi:TatD DNase family protein
VTYKKADDLRAVVAKVPLERMLVETDAPFLAPQPRRGKRNEPAYVAYVAEKIAEVRGLDVAEIGRITTENARRLFGDKLG